MRNKVATHVISPYLKNELNLIRMKQPIRIIDKTPLGYIVELLDTGTRVMLPKLILKQKIKLGVYFIKQPARSRDN